MGSIALRCGKMLSVAAYEGRVFTKAAGKTRYWLRRVKYLRRRPDTTCTAVGLRNTLRGEPDSQIWEGSCPGEQEPSFFFVDQLLVDQLRPTARPETRSIKYRLPDLTRIAAGRSTCPQAPVHLILVPRKHRQHRFEGLAADLPHGALVRMGVAVGHQQTVHELKEVPWHAQ